MNNPVTARGAAPRLVTEAPPPSPAMLVPGDTNGVADVFVRDRAGGTTKRASVGPGGAQANGDSFSRPSISADGRYAAFRSDATNLVPGDTNGVPDVFVTGAAAWRPWATPEPSPSPGGSQAVPGDFVGTADGLLMAAALHNRRGPPTDPTIGACWDADRLNLWRVGLAPARRLLSTAAARSAEVYDWSRGVHAGDPGWPELAVGLADAG